MSTPIDTLKGQALGLGLSGDDVLKFVFNQQNIEREERAREREERAKEIEREEREKEREERERVRQHELEMAKLRTQNSIISSNDPISKPTLPIYREGEDIGSFLIRFERIAKLLDVSEETYAVRLGSVLTGKCVDIYASLSDEVTSNYDLLKKALLTGFLKTPDSYRHDFRSARVKAGETYDLFIIHLSRMFDQWVEACGIEKNYQSLKSFMLLDQFMSSAPPELRTYLKENDVRDLNRAAKLADSWTTAHRTYPRPLCDPKPKRPNIPSRTVVTPPPQSLEDSKAKQVLRKRDYSSLTCHGCGEKGHIRPSCPKNPLRFNTSVNTQHVGFCLNDTNTSKFMTSGTVNGAWVSTILRDTGCSCIIVSEKALPDVEVEGREKVRLADYLGRVNYFPKVKCFIRCPYYEGWTDVIRAPIKFCSVLVGNVPGVSNPELDSSSGPFHKLPSSPDILPSPTPGPSVEMKTQKDFSNTENVQSYHSQVPVQAVQTRAAIGKKVHPLVVPSLDPLTVTPSQFAELQQKCPSLENVRAKIISGEEEETKDGSVFKYERIDGLLYRKCVRATQLERVGKLKLVVPLDCRKLVLTTAHEGLLAGHFSHRKTELRVKDKFHWPGLTTDIRDHCRSCDKCQRLGSKGRVKPVPLKQMPIITEAFSRVAIDLVGPLSPQSSEGHRYILTFIDFSTGFPEAVPLKDISSISVAEALISIFSRVGIPREILSDNGTQFKSELMSQLHRLLGVKPLFTTPYHPSGNGRIERFHSTLKAALRKVCEDKARDWHRYLAPVLFALREMPSDRTGFSAFELLYGRQVRGPMAVLRDLWEDKSVKNDDRSIYEYVLQLRDRLEDCTKIAAQNAEISAQNYKAYFDVKSQERVFKTGDEVLLLLPDEKSKLLLAWKGPYKVLACKNKVNYVINQNGKPKLYHVNLLKRYYRRSQEFTANVLDEVTRLDFNEQPLVAQVHVEGDSDQEVKLDLPDLNINIVSKNPEVNNELTPEQKGEVKKLLEEFKDVFSDIPGCTTTLYHDISLCSTERLKPKLYPIPVHLQSYFREEVDTLLSQGIIRPSQSSHSSPVVMLRKPDGSYRMAIDYRILNSITEFHAEPMCNLEEDLHQFTGAKYFTELDLTKAYYQVPLTEKAKSLTAFPTHKGLMEFNRLPFGLVTACATYIKLMRKVLIGLHNVSFYFDNVLIYGKSWEEQVKAIHSVLKRLREHGLTVKPTKCRFGFMSIQYLGYVLDGKSIRPIDDKIRPILKAIPPSTKKTLRSFLGMVSFYRNFIEHASSLTSPLSDMLRKGVKEPLAWSQEAVDCFCKLKSVLANSPVLCLPDISQPFVLRTDSSDYGLGAILLQYVNNTPFPVAYASRKLSDSERKYSTIERECLGIVFGVQRFKFYLLGAEFILEVDHKPLVYLKNFKGNNSRLLRWALSLQPYRFRLVHIAGCDNVGADFLSRASR